MGEVHKQFVRPYAAVTNQLRKSFLTTFRLALSREELSRSKLGSRPPAAFQRMFARTAPQAWHTALRSRGTRKDSSRRVRVVHIRRGARKAPVPDELKCDKQRLVCLCVLHNQLRLSVDREHEGMADRSEAVQEVSRVAFEVAERPDAVG